ncbi:hypothetical protein EV360DRAFT_78044 [Lentinula raphanica]|nr:hypothetical protein EV360DRAFT_78044 [Lentinula raphanica]
MAPPRRKSARAPRGRKITAPSDLSQPMSAPARNPSPPSNITISSFVDDEASVSPPRIGNSTLSSDEDDGRPGPDDQYVLDDFVVADDAGDLSSLTTDSDPAACNDAISPHIASSPNVVTNTPSPPPPSKTFADVNDDDDDVLFAVDADNKPPSPADVRSPNLPLDTVMVSSDHASNGLFGAGVSTLEPDNLDPRLPSNGYASNDFASNDFASNDFASNDFASNDYASNNFASNGYASNDFVSTDFVSTDFVSTNFASTDFASNASVPSAPSASMASASKVSASKASASKATASKATASKATSSKASTSKATASKPSASNGSASKSSASKSSASKSSASKSSASKSSASKGSASKGSASKGSASKGSASTASASKASDSKSSTSKASASKSSASKASPSMSSVSELKPSVSMAAPHIPLLQNAKDNLFGSEPNHPLSPPSRSSSPELTISSPVPSFSVLPYTPSSSLSKVHAAANLSRIVHSSTVPREHARSPDNFFRPSALATYYAPSNAPHSLACGSDSPSSSAPQFPLPSPPKHSIDEDLNTDGTAFHTPHKRLRYLDGGAYSIERVSPSAFNINGRIYVAVDNSSSSSSLGHAPQVSPVSPSPAVPPPITPSSPDINFDELDIDLPINYKDLPGLRTPSPPPSSSPVRGTPFTSPVRGTPSLSTVRGTPSLSTVHGTPSLSPVRGTPSTLPVTSTPLTSPVRGTPVHGSPIRGTPIRGTPICGTSVHGTSVHGSPVRGTSVYGSPIRGTSFMSFPPPKPVSLPIPTLRGSSPVLPPPLPPSYRGRSTRQAAIAAALHNPVPTEHKPFHPSPALENGIQSVDTPLSPQLVYPPLPLHSPSHPPTLPAASPVISSPPCYLPPGLPTYQIPFSTLPSASAPAPSTPLSPPFLNTHLGDSGCIRTDRIDSRLAVHYQSVHNLPAVNLRPATDDAPSTDDDYLTVDQLLSGLDNVTQQSVLSCLNFTYWGVFVNPSRVSPYPLLKTSTARDGKLRSVLARDESYKTVNCMVGKLESCYVYNPHPSPLPDTTPYLVRGAAVHGINQEVQTAIAHSGLLFRAKTLEGLASAGVIQFCSGVQWDSDINHDFPHDVRPTVPIPINQEHVPISNNSRLRDLPFFKDPLPFNHAIPIFDGRPSADLPAFSAEAWQLSRIGQRSYPLYNNGLTDLPRNSIVFVGYTSHLSSPKSALQGLSKFLSFNLQFLVLLALPPSDTVNTTHPSHFPYEPHLSPSHTSSSHLSVSRHGFSNAAHSSSSAQPLPSPAQPPPASDIVYYSDIYP